MLINAATSDEIYIWLGCCCLIMTTRDDGWGRTKIAPAKQSTVQLRLTDDHDIWRTGWQLCGWWYCWTCPPHTRWKDPSLWCAYIKISTGSGGELGTITATTRRRRRRSPVNVDNKYTKKSISDERPTRAELSSLEESRKTPLSGRPDELQPQRIVLIPFPFMKYQRIWYLTVEPWLGKPLVTSYALTHRVSI